MKKLLKDQKENFHATSKMMRKMREEKDLQKKVKKGRLIKVENNRMAVLVFVLLSFLGILLFSSCGTLNKQVSKDKTAVVSERSMEENRKESFNQVNEQWLESWMQQLHYTTASIYSDSTIRYQPDQGFELSNGAVVFTQFTNRQLKREENKVSNEITDVLSDSKQTDLFTKKENIVRSEKERHPPNLMMFWVGMGVLLTILLWDWNQKRTRK